MVCFCKTLFTVVALLLYNVLYDTQTHLSQIQIKVELYKIYCQPFSVFNSNILFITLKNIAVILYLLVSKEGLNYKAAKHYLVNILKYLHNSTDNQLMLSIVVVFMMFICLPHLCVHRLQIESSYKLKFFKFSRFIMHFTASHLYILGHHCCNSYLITIRIRYFICRCAALSNLEVIKYQSALTKR